MAMLSEVAARIIGNKMIRLLRAGGAGPLAIKLGEEMRLQLIEDAFDGIVHFDEADINPTDVDWFARHILSAQLRAKEREIAEYESKTPRVLVWFAKLVHFREWQAMKEFMEIVRKL